MTEFSCADMFERLSRWLDLELDSDECDELRAHVEQCSTCSELHQAEQHMRALIRRSCSEKAPDSLRSRVLLEITVLRTQRFHAPGS